MVPKDFDLRLIHVEWNAKRAPKAGADLQPYVNTVMVSPIAIDLLSTNRPYLWAACVPTFPHLGGQAAQLAVVTDNPDLTVVYRIGAEDVPLARIEDGGRYFFVGKGKWRGNKSGKEKSYYLEDLSVMAAGEIKLIVRAVAATYCRIRLVPTGFTEDGYESLRRDFNGTLSRLIAREDSPVSVTHPLWNDAPNEKVLDAVAEFSDAVKSLLPSLKVKLREAIRLVPCEKARVCSQTLRDLARHQSTKAVSSRSAVATWDTAENRYVAGMVQHVGRLIRQYDATYRDRLAEYEQALADLEQSMGALSSEASILAGVKSQELEEQVAAVRRDVALYRSLRESRYVLLQRCLALGQTVAKLDRQLKAHFIKTTTVVPASVVFLQNIAYRRAYLSYREVRRLGGVHDDRHDLRSQTGLVQILQLSTLYERWCLLCLLTILLDDFRFVIANGKREQPWRERLVDAVLQPKEDRKGTYPLFSCTLIRQDACRKIELTYEREWKAPSTKKDEIKPGWHQKRPDFELRIYTCTDQPNGVWTHDATLILDAKSYLFRASIPREDPTHLLAPTLGDNIKELCVENDYQNGGGYRHGKNQVFILHPSQGAVENPVSRATWGTSSLYGGEPIAAVANKHADHRYGGVLVTPAHRDNLKRLLLMALEYNAEPQARRNPDPEPRLPLICGRCGNLMRPIQRNHMWYGHGWTYRYRCADANCVNQVYITYCSRCKNRLYRHDTRWMYHNTAPNSLYYVRCPSCGCF